MTKIYRACVKRANGYVGGERFDTKKEAIDQLKEWQEEARYEKKYKRCKPIPAGMFTVGIEYDARFQIVELFLEEAEKPVWHEIGRYSLDDQIVG